jgi:hypothetical protein
VRQWQEAVGDFLQGDWHDSAAGAGAGAAGMFSSHSFDLAHLAPSDSDSSFSLPARRTSTLAASFDVAVDMDAWIMPHLRTLNQLSRLTRVSTPKSDGSNECSGPTFAELSACGCVSMRIQADAVATARWEILSWPMQQQMRESLSFTLSLSRASNTSSSNAGVAEDTLQLQQSAVRVFDGQQQHRHRTQRQRAKEQTD